MPGSQSAPQDLAHIQERPTSCMVKSPSVDETEEVCTFILFVFLRWGFPGGSDGKASACNAGDPGLIPGSNQRRKSQPTPVLLPGKSHGRRSLVGYSPWGRKESDTTE